MSDEEFSAVGGNQSKIHLDFMIGSDEMDVDGITEDGVNYSKMIGLKCGVIEVEPRKHIIYIKFHLKVNNLLTECIE